MKRLVLCSVLTFVVAGSLLFAQEEQQPAASLQAKPQKEHEWLQQFVGQWVTEMEATAMPGQPAMKCQGTIDSRSLGGFWVVSEMKSEMMGAPIQAVQTLGFDPSSKKYIGTWIDNMNSFMWKYEGSLDPTGKELTLAAEGPNFLGDGKVANFRDVYHFQSKDHLIMTSSMQGEDGEWITFATGDARRKQ